VDGMEFHDKEKEEKAKLEDVLAEVLYSNYKGLVFHGGTCIWRCYKGNRFSRDLDFYYAGGKKTPSECYREFSGFFTENGFAVKSKSYSRETNTMQFLVESTRKMKVDINLNYKKGCTVEYLRVDGSRMVVLALSPLELLNEKIDAYNDKLFVKSQFKEPEAQDLYDIYYLTSIISKDDKTAARLGKLIQALKGNPPKNINNLQSLILSGLAPTFEMMIDSIRSWSL
jgi:predicted nucleotidyltransferase component of viral defense system